MRQVDAGVECKLGAEDGSRTHAYRVEAYRATVTLLPHIGDPSRIRTGINGVKGRCPNH